jgi:hypothetical protein
MSDEKGNAAFRAAASERNAESAAVACIACTLIAIGALGAIYGLRRRTVRMRLWPAPKTVADPLDFTAPHGDELLGRT